MGRKQQKQANWLNGKTCRACGGATNRGRQICAKCDPRSKQSAHVDRYATS